jgi:hypothetical protein
VLARMRGADGFGEPGRMSNPTTLRIEHPVPDYDRWKRAFDSDPVGRQRMGVRRYQVLRPVDDPNYVMIDLEFDSREGAEGLAAAMREVWSAPGHAVSADQRVRIASAVERREY